MGTSWHRPVNDLNIRVDKLVLQCVDYTLLLKVYNHFFFFFCIEEVLKFYYYFFFISCCYPICLVSMPQIPLPISNLCFFTLEQSPFKGIWPGSHFFFFFLAFNFHSIQFGTLKRMRDGGEKKNRLFFSHQMPLVDDSRIASQRSQCSGTGHTYPTTQLDLISRFNRE